MKMVIRIPMKKKRTKRVPDVERLRAGECSNEARRPPSSFAWYGEERYRKLPNKPSVTKAGTATNMNRLLRERGAEAVRIGFPRFSGNGCAAICKTGAGNGVGIFWRLAPLVPSRQRGTSQTPSAANAHNGAMP